MGRLTEAAAAGGGASAARSAGPPPTPLPLSSTSPGCTATMASSEEDGANGGASEAGEEREAPGKRRRLGLLATVWLTFYNIAMTAGWLVLAIAMVRFYMEKGTHKGLYKSIQKTLKFFQTFALLEIVHCLIGIVPTSVIVAGVQVSSRIFMVWLITHSIKPIQNEESVVLFLVAWTVTEITRYSFYTFSLLDHLPYFIKWARYNFFIILYPVGVAGELLTIYAALPYVKKTGMFSIRLPNKYNVSFDYYYFLLITMASYIPLFPQLYFHMLRQRRKVLHGEVIVEKDD
ncbi:very-long-chain (3R)-3-hydroxyacyl-CoA dehydratase 1 isoform X1 [Panthera pardus]|uniref:Very-long-chain (3R)-3-hydroxyacyl-CoA dehydratase n=2 Tax=Panthera TaxID=9688 RepID=A0A8C9D7J9_PANLE|nr:very-long-chain (3R)-3-hydroxyacyl-CoA dehydratase 1 isoform X1 [Panthera pardus]XP_042800959.1 very-long-chain (3R)-3-hydroxyacyl-CoA dehydratase 1 isoform X1 [Panthera leo]XP_042847106.1 very-long-chain (3R)-3-hydroxyacyl-CoA dehydratase 1 isoform X1 [Panthera tigris]XP_058537773.1 very-long-chain (3R)-3-hydroxyacyl-CoA dehydratase 1 isoform X1 [Neofelis nebulosa]XP_060515224.1 very-long-chain (3R)-3-hydroxyacyl-CoA dehydratase 1 [Panthera onca]